MDTIQKNELLDYYAGNEMANLKKICFSLITKMGGISQMEYDDLYSIALSVLMDSVERYDEKVDCKFETFLSGNINRKFKTYLRDKHTEGRAGKPIYDSDGNRIYLDNVSLDTEINEEGDTMISMIEDTSFNSRDYSGYLENKEVNKYLSELPKIQREIIQLLMDGYKPSEVRKKLNIKEVTYNSAMSELRKFENILKLKNTLGIDVSSPNRIKEVEEKTMNVKSTVTAEKNKVISMTLGSIIEGMDDEVIRYDHPLQRESEQWTSQKKSNLISDVLQGNPVPELIFAEQFINKIPVVWCIDGKQRCTTCYAYANDGFKIGKNIERYEIEYIGTVVDEEGNTVLDEDGFTVKEVKTFDIRGKKFSQLPKELQKKFKNYGFTCNKYLNCDANEIAYHIKRYNNGKNMTKPQLGIMNISEKYAKTVKSIAAMPFFKELGGYKVSELRNGTVERVVVESIMAQRYLNDWNKQYEKICEYMKNNSKVEDFENFEDMVNRITIAIGENEEVADMFNSRDSFIWFSVFAKVHNDPDSDKKFVEFMAEFTRSLHSKVINGVNWESLNEKSTKDKNSVTARLDYITVLMNEFMSDYVSISEIEEVISESDSIDDNADEIMELITGEIIDNTFDEDVENKEERRPDNMRLNFVKSIVSGDITEEDIDEYSDYIENTVRITSPVYNNCRLALLALVAYAYKSDLDTEFEAWIAKYQNSRSEFSYDQKENYSTMKNAFDIFVQKSSAA